MYTRQQVIDEVNSMRKTWQCEIDPRSKLSDARMAPQIGVIVAYVDYRGPKQAMIDVCMCHDEADTLEELAFMFHERIIFASRDLAELVNNQEKSQ